MVATVKFSLAPGRLTQSIIDYSSTEVIKLFNSDTSHTKTLFDGHPNNLNFFLQQVSDRIKDFGWETICTITNSDGEEVDLVGDYGQYTLKDVKITASAWHGEDNQNRNQQNSYLMFRFLRESLESKFHNKVTLSKNNYMVDGE